MLVLRACLLALSLTLLLTILPYGSCFFRGLKLSSLPPKVARPTVYSPQLYYLFTYGKLKRDEENHYWMDNPENGLSKFMGLGQTVKKYPLLVGKFQTPILLDSPGEGHKVLGEIYVVDTFMLRNLDMLEGLPIFNSRKLEIIRLFTEDSPNGKEMFCWMYFSRVKSIDLTGRDLISEFSSKTCPSD